MQAQSAKLLERTNLSDRSHFGKLSCMVPRKQQDAPQTNPRKLPRQKRALAKIDALLDAAAAVLIDTGYDRASTNSIAKRAGVSIGTLYQYFPTKEAVVLALAERHSDQEFGALRKILVSAGRLSLAEAARLIIGAVAAMHEVNPALHRILITEVPLSARLGKMRTNDRRATALLRAFLQKRMPGVHNDMLTMRIFVTFHAIEGVIHQALIERPQLLHNESFVLELNHLALAYLQAVPTRPKEKP